MTSVEIVRWLACIILTWCMGWFARLTGRFIMVVYVDRSAWYYSPAFILAFNRPYLRRWIFYYPLCLALIAVYFLSPHWVGSVAATIWLAWKLHRGLYQFATEYYESKVDKANGTFVLSQEVRRRGIEYCYKELQIAIWRGLQWSRPAMLYVGLMDRFRGRRS